MLPHLPIHTSTLSVQVSKVAEVNHAMAVCMELCDKGNMNDAIRRVSRLADKCGWQSVDCMCRHTLRRILNLMIYVHAFTGRIQTVLARRLRRLRPQVRRHLNVAA